MLKISAIVFLFLLLSPLYSSAEQGFTKAGFNFRKTPDGKILDVLEGGTEFEILEKRAPWIHVELEDGTKGWIHETGVIEKKVVAKKATPEKKKAPVVDDDEEIDPIYDQDQQAELPPILEKKHVPVPAPKPEKIIAESEDCEDCAKKHVPKTIPHIAEIVKDKFESSGPCGKGGLGKVIVVDADNGPHKTIQAGLNAAGPGDTVFVKPGKYKGEIEFPHSGSAEMGCITLKGEPGVIISGGNRGISIVNKNYVAIVGLAITNINGGDTPNGIHVEGSSSHLEFRNNLIEKVTSNSQAHAMNFEGNKTNSMTDILIDGNELRYNKVGHSETMTLNGNITNFKITNNKIHDNDNIGIDIAGHYGVGPKGQDRANNGLIAHNLVYNNSSKDNVTYHGDRSADCIYVDGGYKVMIEHNTVYNCDIGIEVASEKNGNFSDDVTIRNNNVSNSYHGNISLGGAGNSSGGARKTVVEGNTLSNGRGGDIVLQSHVVGEMIGTNIHKDPKAKKIVHEN